MRDRETERQRERERERERQRDRERQRERDRETERDRDRDRQKDKDRERERGFPGFPRKFPISENSYLRTNFSSRSLGGKNIIYPSRSCFRERKNYGV